MQDEAEERRTFFRKSGNQPSSQEVQEHIETHIPYRFCALIAPEEGGGMIPTGQEEEGEDQQITRTLQLTLHSSRRTTLMIRQIKRATRFS